MATSRVTSAKKSSTSPGSTASDKRPAIQKTPQPIINSESIDLAPVIYADTLIQIGFGPFVTKCTFGTQHSTAKSINAVLTLALPTNAMIDLAKNILAVASAEGQEEKINNIYNNFQANLKTMVRPKL